MTKRVCKGIAMVLVLVTVIQLIPKRLFVQAETISFVPEVISGAQEQTSTDLDTSTPETAATIVGEMVEKRTENAKYFRLSDGSYSVAQYMYDVHFKTEEGYVPYDNTLRAVRSSEKTIYQPTSSDLNISFAGDSIQEGIFTFGRKGYTVGVALADTQLGTASKTVSATVQAKRDTQNYSDPWEAYTDMKDTMSAISYGNVLSNTTLSYTLLGSTIKESIILSKQPSKNSWKFKLTLNGLTAVLQENGDVQLIATDTKEVQYTIPKGYMFDANNYLSDDVTYTLESCKGGVYLTVHADAEWLASSERVYPVTVDPTFWAGGNPSTTFSDAHVLQGNPTLNTKWYNILMAGYSSGSTFLNMRTYIKLKTLPTLPDSAEITSAVLQLKQVPSGQWYSYNSTKNYVPIGAYQVLGAWDDGTITWNNQPAIETSPMDYITVTASTAEKLFKLNITAAARSWYESSNSNYGVVLHAEPEIWKGQVSFISGDDVNGGNPCMYITYRDMRGIEGVYSYDQENVGNAGSGFVNLYTGNLVFAQGGLTSAGNILPMQVGFVYNGYQKGLPFTSNANHVNAPITHTFPIQTGYGWKLNLLETIQQRKLKEYSTTGTYTTIYYVYNDGDGTEHYFKDYDTQFYPAEYLSEDGLALSLEVLDSGEYVLEDDQHNKKYFDTAGRLTIIEDFVGNVKKIVYNSAGYITKVIYTPAQTDEEIDEFLFIYNSAGALIKVVNGRDATQYVEYLYADTYNGTATSAGYKYLRGARYSTGESVTYTYLSNGAWYSAKDEKHKIEVRYTYNGTKVSQVNVYMGDNALADTRTFDYSDRLTTVRTKGADDIPGNTDDYLNAYTFDTYGRTVGRYVTDLDQNKLYGVGHTTYNNATNGYDLRAQNTIADQSSAGNLAQNLIRNGNCESFVKWNSLVDPLYGSVYCASNEKYYGDYSFAISMSADDTGSIIQQYTAPTTGRYTLSAYVRVSGVEPRTASDGAKIFLNNESSLTLVGTTSWDLGWERLIVSRNYEAGDMITVTLQLEDSCGTAYFDCVQLEMGSAASAYNFVDDGDFDSGSINWDVDSGNCSFLSEGGIDNSPCVELIGRLSGTSMMPQTIPMNLDLNNQNITLFVSGWGKGKTAVQEGKSIYTGLNDTYANKERDFAIHVVLKYQGSQENESYLIHFNPEIWDEWQFSSGTIRLQTTGKLLSVEISPYLSKNATNVRFDNFSLIIGSTTGYTYDTDGYLTSVREKSGNQQTMDYTNHQITSMQTHTDDMAYEYDYYPTSSEYRYQLMSVWYPNGMTINYDEYDEYGNVTLQSIYEAAVPCNQYNEINYTYDYYGNFLASETNPHGTTTYDYNEATGVLNYVQNANNNRTAYIYDASGKLLHVFADGNKNGTKESTEQGVQYVYDTQNRLLRIVTASTTYHFTYNAYGQTTAITVGGRATPLARYTYNAYGGKLIRTDYADGTYITNTYDDNGRVQSVSYNGTVLYTVTYDGQGNVSSCTDHSTGYKHRYDYDAIDRIRQYWIVSGEEILLQNSYTYQEDGRIYIIRKSVAGLVEHAYILRYDTYGNIDEFLTYNSNVYLDYDSMNRVSQRRINRAGDIITTDYTYYTSGEITTDRVSSMRITLEDGTVMSFVYTYDALGNITSINDGTETRLYTYDALNQLTSEIIYANSTKIGTKVTYSYDQTGNLVSKTHSVYNNGIVSNSTTDTYTYGNSDWGDLLTAYNGEGITYDANGNPLSYYNGKRYTFSWQYGRRLASASVDGKTYTYTYNAEGLRVTKTVDGVVHTYYYDGTELVLEKWGNCYIRFIYDDQGRPLSMSYFDGSTLNRYHYILNLQGDVIAIMDSNEDIVCNYTYDAWGKILSIKDGNGNAITAAGHIGNLNPLRYRGYYYDNESGFYYVSSRYYDPEIGRWINADNQIAGVGGEVLGYNMFAYCMNNPVNMSDPSGNWPRWATIALGAVAAVAAVAVTVVTLGAAAPAAACTLTAVGMSIGASYAVASTAATVAVAATTVAAAAYAGDIAYSAVTGDSLLLDTVFQGNTAAYNTGLAMTSIATAGMLEMAAQSPGVCFVAGTPVLAACGYIVIEEIKAGDMVWSQNPETGEKELKEVVQTFVNETTELIYVYVGNEEIITTPEHPFYSPVKGWIAACKLRAGDILVLQNGKYVTVEKVQHEVLEAPITVYNFEVADFHTYYVGKNAVLVHNTCGGKPTSPNQMQKQVERGQAPSTVVRVDNPKIPGQLPHIHFSDGTAMNIDGSIHDAMRGVHTLTNSERIWIFDNGWGG